MALRDHLGWYKHGKLPHFDCAGLYQSITCRLDDSLPEQAMATIEAEFRTRRIDKTALEIARRKRIEALLDAGHGSCILGQPHNAGLVMDAWRQFDGERYDLIIGVVMPNHMHVLVRVHQGTPLGTMVKTWKTFTSRRFAVDESVGYRPAWQRGYWDRYIRNEAHYADAVRYILFNPVKAGLVTVPAEWPYLVLGRGVDLEIDPPAAPAAPREPED
ncbi:transposase [Thiohalocapsa sp. ML1]|uniref:REP-associated tyrosine transposase n=1 Tax=Thiohalocapsa sp. ML1 TaxID=1431688 RepID=UPI000732024E|nr:transposase [Thiohalocapsa sp. ML1]